jgi:CheY-like chemotaxis protein
MTYRILVGEDDEPTRRLVSTVLTRQGYTVDIAENGATAIARIEAATYDAIVLDLMMPVMNGLQVLEWLTRERPGTTKNTVIVLTAASPRDLSRFDQDNVFAVLRKPFDLGELLLTIEGCVARSSRVYP